MAKDSFFIWQLITFQKTYLIKYIFSVYLYRTWEKFKYTKKKISNVYPAIYY